MKRFIPLSIVLLITLILAFLFNDFVRIVIVEPLFLIIWVVTTYLRNLPHFVYWIGFIIVALIVLIKSLDLRISLPQRRRSVKLGSSRGYVAGWQDQLERADRQLYFRWQLAKSLAKLSQQILTTDVVHQDEAQPTPAMLETLPPEIAAYFKAPPPRKPAAKVRWYHRQPENKNKALELDPEVVIAYLEEEMGWK